MEVDQRRFRFELEFHKVSTIRILCKLVHINSVLRFVNLVSSKQFSSTSLSAMNDLLQRQLRPVKCFCHNKARKSLTTVTPIHAHASACYISLRNS